MFERSKLINGLEYRYLVRSERQGVIVRQRVIKYLGPVEPIYKKIKRRIRSSNAWLFARKLTKKEEEKVKKALASSVSFTRDRARIILASQEEKQCSQITQLIRCDLKKVRAAIHNFNKYGVSCLQQRKAHGAKQKFTKQIKKEICKQFSQQPKEFDYYFTTWTLSRFRKHLMEHKIVDSICIESVRQIILQSGARLKKSKRWQYSPDKEFHKKNKK